MMFEKEKNQLGAPNYIGLAAVIILLLLLMFLLVNLAYFTKRASDQLYYEEYFHLKQSDYDHSDFIVREGSEEYYFTLIAKEKSKVEDALKKTKIPYSQSLSLENIQADKGHLILNGSDIKERADAALVKQFIKDGKNIIFLNMPSAEIIDQYHLEVILGIGNMREESKQTQLNLVPGFMLGGFHELTNIDYKSHEVNLLGSTKVYGYGGNQMPIIWRNLYQGSQIYVVNGPFMESNASYGILSSIIAQMYDDYIYPIVNARLMIYEDLPYVTKENTAELEGIYSRDAMKLQNDILLPDILTINQRREFISNGYFKAGFGGKHDCVLDVNNIKQVNNSKDKIIKAGGEVGMSYSGNLEEDLGVYRLVFPDEAIKSILLRQQAYSLDDLLQVSGELESILGPWGEDGFKYLDDDVVYVPFTVDGVDLTGQEKLEFLSGVTAFGAIIQNLSIEDVLMVKGGKEHWRPLSRSYIKFIDTYRERFDFMQNSNITRTTHAAQVFINNSPHIKIRDNKIKITFDHQCGKASFILRTDKKIDQIKNGEYETIEKGVYLITSMSKEVDISISEYQNKTQGR